MITIKKEKIAAMMFDIWKESDKITNLLMADEYIANKINEAINYTHCSLELCECAMPDPIDPYNEVDKDTCRKCNNHISTIT